MAHLVDQAHRTDSMDVAASSNTAGRFVTVTGKQTVLANAPGRLTAGVKPYGERAHTDSRPGSDGGSDATGGEPGVAPSSQSQHSFRIDHVRR